MNHSFLFLVHKNSAHIIEYANKYPNYNFYIHFDKKMNVNIDDYNYDNIYIVPDYDRVDIQWAGFSMIVAMINLLKFAYSNEKEGFFHMLSGDDFIFFENLDSLRPDEIYIESKESIYHNYRLRFRSPHANKSFQNKLIGKCLTLFLRILDRFLPRTNIALHGSQWFSLTEKHLKIILNSISEKDISFFKNVLCPDEHFFQFIIDKEKLSKSISQEGNKRYIVFLSSHSRGKSPITLSSNAIPSLISKGYISARKFESTSIINHFRNS